ncbi:hypothetical protein [Nitratireductor basaltis]|uniref:Co-chaperone DjlA N-terminal domain-containing protein n=1 Tax=Nitratireductor basaltis TaxID=472175 RepID=A0A084UA12_9HYPH|nr:hypothetical protein [Nitratireductor basaltis]KFB09798.1 hypothetical protein EL18_00817 [Nitratireductor basaltis]
MPVETVVEEKPQPIPAAADHASDVMLLLRLVLSEGPADGRTRQMLENVARASFEMDETMISSLMPKLMSFGSSGSSRASAALQAQPPEHRAGLAGVVLAAAKREPGLRPHLPRMASRLAVLLDISESDFAGPRA